MAAPASVRGLADPDSPSWSGWAATGAVTGVDGAQHRWVFGHYMLASPTATAPEIVVRAGTPVDLGGGRGTVTPTVVGVPPMTRRGGPTALDDAGEAVIALGYPFDGSTGNALLVAGNGNVAVGSADLALTATWTVGAEATARQPLTGGEQLIRAIIENRGSDLATAVRLELAGEAGKKLTIVGVEGGTWQCGTDCRGPALRPGERQEELIRVASDLPNTITLTASVPGSVDPTPEDNVRTVVLAAPDSSRESDVASGNTPSCDCRVPRGAPSRTGLSAALALATLFAARRRRSS